MGRVARGEDRADLTEPAPPAAGAYQVKKILGHRGHVVVIAYRRFRGRSFSQGFAPALVGDSTRIGAANGTRVS